MAGWGALLVVLAAASAGCRGPAPVNAFGSSANDHGRQRIVRIGEALLPKAAVRWRLTSRQEVGAWAWPDGRIEVSQALLDLLDDDELAAALAHELGHLLDRGHLDGIPRALAGESAALERRADGIGCRLLDRRGVSGEAMIRMLSKLARATRDRDGRVAARIATAREVCTPTFGRRLSSAGFGPW
jgi:Zn-dependent protease with chaperone function